METLPTMCLNCSTVCGMIAKVQDGKILKLEGNPKDPNSKGKLCAKGQAAINMVEDPDRLLYPMKRVGPRGSGQWERITWEEAIETVAERLRPLRRKKEPEKLLFQYGRDRTNGFLDRFTNAFGTPNKLGHRGLCSLNKRMAIKYAIGDTDWDTADLANSRYILNFGSNFYEAHQGHVGMLQRVAKAKREGAHMVTFDVRLSNTAAQSHEWIPLLPGTDGLVALAIGHVILRENLQDTEFIENWTNASLEEWRGHYKQYTPEWAETESGVSATVIERLAQDFAAMAPHVTTVSNRGAHAHQNGFHNEWAILCLNAMVGSIGKEGGYNYIPGDV
ncbi:MAG TPA: molybdopterin-dependent oxidoreductase, partial [Candidatus Angelobacter sp.]|nr:molybdopterin-dependent oxidoreductase [Candidatus Angelobacter sp.]